MKPIRTLLVITFLCELIWIGFSVIQQINQPQPPSVDLGRLDPLTADELESLRKSASVGGFLEWRELAEAYLGNGYYVAAEQCFRHASELNSADLNVQYARGFCLERMGKTSAAIQVLRHVVKNAKEELAKTCWYQIGRCFLREENLADAEAAFRQISGFPAADYQLAKLLIRSGREDEAKPILEAQLKVFPNSLKLLQLQRNAAAERGDIKTASKLENRISRARYQLVLEYGQDFIMMFANRIGLSARLSKAMQTKESGSVESQQAALKVPLDIIRANQLWQLRSVLVAAANVEIGLGNISTAETLVEELEKYTQTGADLMELKAKIAESRGDYQLAYQLRLRLVSMRPTAELYRQLSITKIDIDESQRLRLEALEQLRNGIDDFQRNDVEKAIETFLQESVVSTLSEDAIYHYYLGEALLAADRRQEALKSFERCLEVDPYFGRAEDRVMELGQFLNSEFSGTIHQSLSLLR